MENLSYPRLLRRVRAVFIDSLIVSVVTLGFIVIAGSLQLIEPWVKALFLVGPIILLEPGLVTLTGGTIGHHLMKIRVRKANTEANINILAASVRFFIKVFLGWASLVTVLTTRRHQAVHDYFTGSIVVNKSNQKLSSIESLVERVIEEEGYCYPSTFLRLLMMVIYNFGVFIVVSLLMTAIQFIDCSQSFACEFVVEIASFLITIVWLFLIGLIIVFAWKARLYGCRRMIKENTTQITPETDIS